MKIHTHIMYIVEYDKYLRLLRNQQKLFMVSTKNANYLLVAKPVEPANISNVILKLPVCSSVIVPMLQVTFTQILIL